MKKLVSVRQLILILFISVASLKVLFLPSLMAKEFGKNFYFYFIVFVLIDFLMLLVLLFLMNKNKDLSFFEMLEKMFGKAITKIIIFFLLIFFLLKCFASFLTNYIYLNDNLYSVLDKFIYSIPILVVVFYISKFGVNAFSRLCEFCVPVVIAGLILSLFVGVYRADYTNILPLFEEGIFSSVGKSFKFAFWFGDYIPIIVFFGNIKEDKKINLKIIVSMIIWTVIGIFFMLTVIAVFGESAICHSNAISDMLQILPSTSDLGSFDWLLVLIWDIALFLYFSLNCLCSFYCLRQLFQKLKQDVVMIIILVTIFIGNLILNFDVYFCLETIKNFIWIFSIIIQYFVPILCFIFSFKVKRRVKNEISS